MRLSIDVKCDQCGTSLETPDVIGDITRTVIIKARPCPKCCRPDDCQLTCEDVLSKEKELDVFRSQVAKLEEKIKTLSSLMPIEDEDDIDDDIDDDDPAPSCFGKGKYKEDSHNCQNCDHRVGCMNA